VVMKEGIRKADPMMWVYWTGVVVVVAVFVLGAYRSTIRVNPNSGRTLRIVIGIEEAVGYFEAEYGGLPEVGSSTFDADDKEGRLLAEILLGREADEIQGQNPRKIPFLGIEMAKSRGKGGLLYGKESEVLGIYDVWGEPFEILLRKPGERGITLTHRGKTVMLERPVVVFSKGKDRIAGTEDDVRMWE
jgi:hypothetical protein